MKIFDFNDIQEMNISPARCYEWVSDMIRHKKDVFLPPKIHMNMEGNVFCNVMPCIIPSEDHRWGGVKVVTRYPKRVPSLDSKLLLFDAETGEMAAMMDANWITAMRTGAVAAHSVMHFAKKNFQTIGMIGLGNTARAAMLCLADITDKEIHVNLLRYKDQAEQFAARFAAYPNLRFTILESAQDIVRNSDVVISCATYFDKDLCSDDCYAEGILLVPVHTRGFTNCDLFFDKVFADDTAHVADFRNFSKFRSFAEVSDAVNGLAPGRENNRERILAYNIGISLHDIAFASKIYQIAQEEGRLGQLQTVDFQEPSDKFWI